MFLQKIASKLSILICISGLANLLKAQNYATPFDSRINCKYAALHGKIFPWLLIGTGINYTLGFEYGLNRKNSIGFDLVYNDASTPHDVKDPATNQYVPGPRVYDVNRAVFLNYRYYLNCFKWRDERGFTPYLQTFLRYGKVHSYFEPGYITNTISYEEWHYSGGIVFGIIFSTAVKNLGIDVNAGIFEKQKMMKEVASYSTGAFTDLTNTWITGPRIGLNLYYWFSW